MSDAIWLDVLPSLTDFASELTRGTAAPAAAAGRTAGQQWSRAMGDAGTSGAQSLVNDLERSAKESANVVERLTGKITAARAAERGAAANLILAEQKLTDARAKYGEDSAQARAAEIRLESAREKAEATSIRYTAAEDQLRAAQRERREVTSQLEQATADLANETNDLSDDVTGQRSLWDRFRGDLSGAEDDAGSLGGELGELAGKLAAAATAAVVFGEGWSNNMDLSVGVSKLTASMDLTAEQSERAGDAAGSLYAQAYGESMEEVTSATGTVMSTISGLRDASTEDIEKITGAALTMASAFDLDIADAAAAANNAISNGLAPDATSAFDLISASLQQVPEALRGDVLDAANEYGGVMSGLGLTGEQAFAMWVDASANGTIAIDKVGDALKELTINVGTDLEGKTPIFEQLGLDAGEMSRSILAGGDQAQDALQKIVGGLQAVEDPSARATAAIGLFGTPLEDLGVTEIPAFLDSLSAMDTGLGDTVGTISEMSTQMTDNVPAGLESLKRGFMGAVTEGIEPLLGPAQSVLEWAASIPGGFEAVAIAVGALGIGVAAYTVAQWAMNTAMFASPIFWVVAAVGVLIAAIILLSQNWESVTSFITEKWNTFTGWMGDTLHSLGGWFSDTFGGIKDSAVEKFTGLIDWVKGVPGAILSTLGSTGSLLKDAGKQIISGFFKGLTDRFEDVKKWVGGVGSWIADHKGPKAYDLGLLVPAGGWIMDGLRHGLEAEIPALENTLGKVSNTIRLDSTLASSVSATSARSTDMARASARGTTGGLSTTDSSRKTTVNVGDIHVKGMDPGEIVAELSWIERTASL